MSLKLVFIFALVTCVFSFFSFITYSKYYEKKIKSYEKITSNWNRRDELMTYFYKQKPKKKNIFTEYLILNATWFIYVAFFNEDVKYTEKIFFIIEKTCAVFAFIAIILLGIKLIKIIGLSVKLIKNNQSIINGWKDEFFIQTGVPVKIDTYNNRYKKVK